MKFEVSNRLATWLRATKRDDLANHGEADVSQLKYFEVFLEVRQQHPEEDLEKSQDRALFRMLTHPEWAPTRKKVAQFTAEKRERWLRYAWAIAVLLLLLLIAVRSHGQDKVVYQAQGKESIRSERLIYKGPPVIVTESPTPPPPLTADQKLRISDLRHKYDDLRVQMAKLEMDKMKLERQITDVLSSINGVAFDIARESKVATDHWNLNIDSLMWEKRK